jgi:formylglycine-generating enzyme required for sulfatase activity
MMAGRAAAIIGGALLVVSVPTHPVPEAAAATAQDPPDTVTLETLLERAGQYILTFEERFSGVVTEERYQQEASGAWSGGSAAGLSPGQGAFGPSAQPRTERRELVSDFLLVKLPGSDDWLPFRDVFEVDRQRIRDRDDRLTTLFLQPESTALLQARRIMEESARYNIGDIGRTFNLPVFALKVLHPSVQPRFRFWQGRIDRSVGSGVHIVEYEETATPTLIHGSSDRDLFSTGRFSVDGPTGRVLRSEMVVDDTGLRASITTRYQLDPAYGVAVPVDMREEYSSPEGARVTGFATYGRFRNFNVEVEDALAKPPRTITDPVTGMTLVEIPSGRFTMGSPASEAGRRDDERPREIAIDRPYFLGQFEVTHSDWRAVMGGAPGRFPQCGPTCPVENVSLVDVQLFLATLNRRTSDVRYRLPTEAEWEYACRAGSASRFSTGEVILTTQANFNGLAQAGSTLPGVFREQPVAVGSLGTNVWGLGDMHGNVAEWTAEGVVRGGSWQSEADGVRCAWRDAQPASTRAGTIGFRIAADLVSR